MIRIPTTQARFEVPEDPLANQILPEPMQLGAFKICPRCNGWFSLEFVRSQRGQSQGLISIYRCRKCAAEAEFAEHHPPGAI